LQEKGVVLVGDYAYGDDALKGENRRHLESVQWIEKHAQMLTDPAKRETFFGMLDHAVRKWHQATDGKNKPVFVAVSLPDIKDPTLAAGVRNHLFDTYPELVFATAEKDGGVYAFRESVCAAYSTGVKDCAIVLDMGHETVNCSVLRGGIGSDAKPADSLTIGGSLIRGGKHLESLFAPELARELGRQKDVDPAKLLTPAAVKGYKEQTFGFVPGFNDNYDSVSEQHRRMVVIPFGKRFLHLDMTRAADSIPRKWLQQDIVPAVMDLINSGDYEPEFLRDASKNFVVNGGITKMPYFATVLEGMLHEAGLGDARVTCVKDPTYSVVQGALEQMKWQRDTPGKRNYIWHDKASA